MMKRFMILAIVAVSCTTICLSQRRSRTSRLKVIQLAEPNLSGSVSLEEALAKRRTVRQFTGRPLKPTQVSQLAWAGQGITEPVRGLRTTPSFFSTPPAPRVERNVLIPW